MPQRSCHSAPPLFSLLLALVDLTSGPYMAQPLDKPSLPSLPLLPSRGIFGELLALDGEKQKPRSFKVLSDPWKILLMGLLTCSHPIAAWLSVSGQDLAGLPLFYLGCGPCKRTVLSVFNHVWMLGVSF